MRRLVFLLVLVMAPAVHAQAPEPGPGTGRGPGRAGRPDGPPPFARGPGFGLGMRAPAGPPGDVASFLLAHTAELKLNDGQVTRLAALARRSGERREAAMRAMDSLATRRMRTDSAGRRPAGPPAAMRAEAERQRDARHTDLREALGVLTPDQQATAWELRGRP